MMRVSISPILWSFLTLAFLIHGCADSNKKKKGGGSKCPKTTPTQTATQIPAAGVPAATTTGTPAASLYDENDEGFALLDAANPNFDDVKTILKNGSSACKATATPVIDCAIYETVKTNIVAIIKGLPDTTPGADFKKITLWQAGGMLAGAAASGTPTPGTPAPATGAPLPGPSTGDATQGNDCP